MEEDAKCEREHELVSVELPAPSGWKKKYTPMKAGISNTNEIIFISPSCDEIRGKKQLAKYLRSHTGGPSMSEFDWGYGETPRRSARISKKMKALETLDEELPKKRVKVSSSKKSRNKKDSADTQSDDEASDSDKIDTQASESAKDEEPVVTEGITKNSSIEETEHENDAKVEDEVPESDKEIAKEEVDALGVVDNTQECNKVSRQALDGGEDATMKDEKEETAAKIITAGRNEGTKLEINDINTGMEIERIATQEQESAENTITKNAEDSSVTEGKEEAVAKLITEENSDKIVPVEEANNNAMDVAIDVEVKVAIDVFVNEEKEEGATKDIGEDCSFEGNKIEAKEGEKIDQSLECLGEDADMIYGEDDFAEGNDEYSSTKFYSNDVNQDFITIPSVKEDILSQEEQPISNSAATLNKFGFEVRTHDAKSYKEDKDEALLNDSHHREPVSPSKAISTDLQNPQKASAVVGMRD